MYKCFQCRHEVKEESTRRRFRGCIYCGGRVLFKSRTRVTKNQAR